MRTATRRLRTALDVYADVAPGPARKRAARELRRVTRRLGAVRDLDILIKTDADRGIDPLRRSWKDERRAARRRLETEIRRPRFDRSLERTRSIAHRASAEAERESRDRPIVRVAYRAPALIWAALGDLLSHEVNPNTDKATVIHQLRIVAKKLRYTIEAMGDAMRGGPALIERVTALQDAAGEMHDAIVAAQRARSFLDAHDPGGDATRVIGEFADAQDRRAEGLRPTITRALEDVRSADFRQAVVRSLVMDDETSDAEQRRWQAGA